MTLSNIHTAKCDQMHTEPRLEANPWLALKERPLSPSCTVKSLTHLQELTARQQGFVDQVSQQRQGNLLAAELKNLHLASIMFTGLLLKPVLTVGRAVKSRCQDEASVYSPFCSANLPRSGFQELSGALLYNPPPPFTKPGRQKL